MLSNGSATKRGTFQSKKIDERSSSSIAGSIANIDKHWSAQSTTFLRVMCDIIIFSLFCLLFIYFFCLNVEYNVQTVPRKSYGKSDLILILLSINYR